MTLAYAAYSKKDKHFVIGTDNLDCAKDIPVSKLRFLADRYVIAVTGCDNPIYAIDEVVRQNSNDNLLSELPDVKKLYIEIINWTKEYTQAQIEKYKDDLSAQSAFEIVRDMVTSLVIFDSNKFELYECALGKLYPPKVISPNKVKLNLLSENELHFFAMACNRLPASKATLPEDIYLNPKEELEKLIKLDAAFHDKERKIQGDAKVPQIGKLGAYSYFSDGAIQFRDGLNNSCSSTTSND